MLSCVYVFSPLGPLNPNLAAICPCSHISGQLCAANVSGQPCNCNISCQPCATNSNLAVTLPFYYARGNKSTRFSLKIPPEIVKFAKCGNTAKFHSPPSVFDHTHNNIAYATYSPDSSRRCLSVPLLDEHAQQRPSENIQFFPQVYVPMDDFSGSTQDPRRCGLHDSGHVLGSDDPHGSDQC